MMRNFNLDTKKWQKGAVVCKFKGMPPRPENCKEEDNWVLVLEYIPLPEDYTKVMVYDFNSDSYVKVSEIISKEDCPEGAEFLVSIQPVQQLMQDIMIYPATCDFDVTITQEEPIKVLKSVTTGISGMKEISYYYARSLVDSEYHGEIFGEKIQRRGSAAVV